MGRKNTTFIRDVPRTPSQNTPTQAEVQSRRYLIAAFGSLCVIMLMVALDATSLAVALPVSLTAQTESFLLLVLLSDN
jgi:hypothetical protein